MKPEFRSISFQHSGFKSAGKGEFEAVVSTYGVVDSYNSVIVQGAFDTAIQRYAESGKQFKVLWSHNPEKPIGVATLESLPAGDERLPEEVRPYGGLLATARVNTDSYDGAQAMSHLAFGSVDEFSVGMYIDSEWEEVRNDGVRQINRADIFEISPVVLGANSKTGVLAVRGAFGSFDEHADGLSELIQDFLERAQTRMDQRHEKRAGRVLSAANVAKLQALADTLRKANRDIQTMLATATKSKDEEPSKRTMTPAQARAYFISKGIN